ncbi:MAG: aspartate aminotransferase family protein [Gammaproteobacteria bacterium]|nr:MAG: aspartate aminotransferase family protein [Gammaproteobacteria bacterium]
MDSQNEASRTPSLETIDQNTIIHPFTNLRQFASGEIGGPRIIEGGSGITVTDQKGREYIDAFGGLYCVNVGYGRRKIADAIHEQAKKLAYYHAYAASSNEPAIRLSEKLLAMAPAGMSKVFYGLSGSDANETQVKIVWYYNNVLGRKDKKKIISRHRGYHGGTIMSGSLTGLPVFHTAFDLPVRPVLHTSTPHYYWGAINGETEREFAQRCADELEQMIVDEGPDTVAAFIAEPVLGTGGLIPPPDGYWPAVQSVLKKYDVLLIADEVVCGFGRLGTSFGCDYYDIKPDLVTIAKGLTSAYLPLSGAMVSDEIWRVLEEGSDQFGPFAHGYTYSAHPLCAAAGLANLEILEDERLAEHVAEVGPYLLAALVDRLADHPFVGEVRGVGMLAAVEFVADRAKKVHFDIDKKIGPKLAEACLERGLISRAMPHGDILGFAPPLIISRDEIDQVVDIVGQAVDSVFAKAGCT